MKLASLYSGGKDSTYSIFEIKKLGHDVACLISILPEISDSLLFHYPNIHLTGALGQAIGLPIREFHSGDAKLETEISVLENAISIVKDEFGIDGIVHGGISSKFQKRNFEKVCRNLHLSVYSPLWNLDPAKYLHNLIDEKFKITIVSVSALGLGKEWLGITLNHEYVNRLEFLSTKYGFNLNFEGGEGETLVVDCPIYKKKLKIREGVVKWFGDNGIFEISDYELIDK
ncbi:MAG TPA: diphthine--ammonia ligase [Nitrososphaeraceae archaeon]|nr:diphthine--ammonia ligase [Nitrososphaeraceae archaeon]